MYFVRFWKKVGLPPALFFSVCNIFTYYRIIFISFLILFAKEKKSVIAYLKNPVSLPSNPINTPLFFSFHHTNRLSFRKIHFPCHYKPTFFIYCERKRYLLLPCPVQPQHRGNRLFFSYKQTFIPTKKTEKMSVLLWEKVGSGMKIGLFCNERKSVLARKKVGFFYI